MYLKGRGSFFNNRYMDNIFFKTALSRQSKMPLAVRWINPLETDKTCGKGS
jgi:hypothetical protein